ncbi:unnamed protein product, partial [Closterium sp. Naga37s-1]
NVTHPSSPNLLPHLPLSPLISPVLPSSSALSPHLSCSFLTSPALPNPRSPCPTPPRPPISPHFLACFAYLYALPCPVFCTHPSSPHHSLPPLLFSHSPTHPSSPFPPSPPPPHSTVIFLLSLPTTFSLPPRPCLSSAHPSSTPPIHSSLPSHIPSLQTPFCTNRHRNKPLATLLRIPQIE